MNHPDYVQLMYQCQWPLIPGICLRCSVTVEKIKTAWVRILFQGLG